MSRKIAFKPYRPVPVERLFNGGTPDDNGCIATAEPVLQALSGWNEIADQYPDLPACIKATLDNMPGIENVQVVDTPLFFPGMGSDAAAACAAGTQTRAVMFANVFALPAVNAEGDPTGIKGWALSPIAQGGPTGTPAAKFANPKGVFDNVNEILQRNFDKGVGAYIPPPKQEDAKQGPQAHETGDSHATEQPGAGQTHDPTT